MLKKGDLYYPTKAFRKKAWIKNDKIYKEADKDPVLFWEKLASELFWQKKWKKAFEHEPPYFRWFVGGRLNITENIFEKNQAGWEKIKNKPALIWEPEPIDEKPKEITYGELFASVCRLANALKKLGAKKGDRVGIYLPMIPEAVISMLACARIGAVHSVIFSAFSPHSLQVRLQDTEAKILITADGYWRRGRTVNLKDNADEGVKETKVEKIIVVRRTGSRITWQKGRDFWFEDLLSKEKGNLAPEIMEAEDLFFILYTSGSTGKPKGVLHSCGGYMVQAYWTGKWIFDFHKDDLFWCTSDPGWITGHTYTVYSPLLNGITTLMFEGAPDWPSFDRWAQIIEKHGVTIFYTAPTAIRMFEKYGADLLKKYKFKNLRLLGSVGEPIDQAAWLWYFEKVGKEKCPIVDTWWQTETGGVLISSLPGLGPFKPSFAGLPFPGVKAEIIEGNLVILPPFSPGMFRGIYKDPEKYQKTYWSQYLGVNSGQVGEVYFTSDGALRDENGLIRIVGRVDDVLKVAGHRLTTGELESAVNLNKRITECAVIGVPDEIKGETPVVFAVSLQDLSQEDRKELKREIIAQIKKEIGPIALPKEVYLPQDLPKTRSGKIMRRVLKRILSREELGDLSTLANPESVKKIEKEVRNNQRGSFTFFLNFLFIAAGVALLIYFLFSGFGFFEDIPGMFGR